MPQISRRSFLQTATLTATAAWLAPRTMFAADDPIAQMRAGGITAKITTQALRRNVSVLMGSGGNIAVLAGPDGKLLVDSGFATSRPQIAQALAAISSAPLTTLVNTHWHFDHTDGNEWLHGAGATIVAHQNTLTRLSTTQQIAAFGATFPPSPAGALPTITFHSSKSLSSNGESLALTHYEPAHTDTDISVYFTEADILHCGDTWFHGVYPFIDYSTGGNINGMILAAQRNLATASAKTILIPGHGPVGNRQDLAADLNMMTTIRDAVAALKQQGKSADEAVAAKPTAAFDAKYGVGGIVPPDNFVRLVYQGV
ncbi:MAG: MBL fold metallo-hydrolase [Acidobacteriota bacterium]|nr:MBL fold metallo-hydrolase [Acidobacteriota bacterium]